MRIKRSEDLRQEPVDMEGAKDVFKSVLIGPDEGSGRIIMRRFRVLPGGHTPRHRHDFEHVVKIQTGGGIVLDGAGAEHRVSAGDCIFVPADEGHQFKNPLDEVFEFLCTIPGEG